jgi:large subunit ribosomal protein L28e
VLDTVLTRGQLAIARTSALLQAQKEPKPTPEKKTRGKKKASVKAAAVDEE